tara:strand:+ start:5242 stop:5466 length:225 start_codon:yes stop_codon:yes gene_type:complete
MAEIIYLAEVRTMKEQTKIIRKNRFYKSKLDKHHDSLIGLQQAGATKAEIQRWLKKKDIKVVWTTVHRWLQKHG